MLLTAEGLKNLVDAADEKGMLVHIHALGDRAVKQSLDAFEIARKSVIVAFLIQSRIYNLLIRMIIRVLRR